MAHHVRQDIHRLTAHTSIGEFTHLLFCFFGIHPVIIRTCRLFIRMADICEMFGARYICRMASMKIGIGEGFMAKLMEYGLSGDTLVLYAYLNKPMRLFVRAVAPPDIVRLCKASLLVNPFL